MNEDELTDEQRKAVEWLREQVDNGQLPHCPTFAECTVGGQIGLAMCRPISVLLSIP